MAIIGFISLGCAKNQVDCERMMYRVQEAGHTVSPQIGGCRRISGGRNMAIIGFISLGCAKNQVDCERMMYRVQEAGHTVSPQIDGCDIAVINTCGFIDSAKTEAIDNILQAGALKGAGRVGKILVTGCLSQRYQQEILDEMPEVDGAKTEAIDNILQAGALKGAGRVGKILVTGCLSQRYQQEILDEMPEVDGVLGTGSYTEIVPAIEKLLRGEPVFDFGDIDAPEVEVGRVLTTPEHYAYLKIAEGCDNHCAYCVIPSLRGRFRSRGLDEVLYEARVLASQGIKELIVVAQDTSRYGTDFPGGKRLLATLLRELCKIDGIHWVRLHYLYPDEIDDELIDTIANEPKIVKYLDIPIQHCNDAILEKMNRRGNGDYLRWLLPELWRR